MKIIKKSTSKIFKVNNLNELKSKYLKCINNSDVIQSHVEKEHYSEFIFGIRIIILQYM